MHTVPISNGQSITDAASPDALIEMVMGSKLEMDSSSPYVALSSYLQTN